MASTDNIHIGASGYSFKDWEGPFYPAGAGGGSAGLDQLAFYSRYFDTVEINSTYYRIASRGAFESMLRRTDPGFRFVVKLHGSMTHELSEAPAPDAALLDAVAPLADAGRLDGLLAQFPWGFRRSAQNLNYLDRLAGRFAAHKLFFEFRHISWITAKMFDWMRERGIGYCIVDEPQLKDMVPPVMQITCPVTYVRLHGRNETDWWRPRPGSDRYLYDYSERELQEWASRVRSLADHSEKVLVFFNNCHFGHAPLNARRLKELLGLSGLRENLPGELPF